MRSPAFLVAACLCATPAIGQGTPTSPTASSPDQMDTVGIQEIEDEWLRVERTTDVAALEHILGR